MARQPNRTPQEKLEDLFFDMTVPEQEKALATFQTLHRMKRRLFDKPKAEPATEVSQGSLLDVTGPTARAKDEKWTTLPNIKEEELSNCDLDGNLKTATGTEK